MVEFNNRTRLKNKEDNENKRNTFDSVSALYEDRELILHAFKSGIFTTQLKAGNTSYNLLNKITQIIYSLYRGKDITKKRITI